MKLKYIFWVHKFVDNLDVICASMTVFLLHININWADKIVGGLISVCFSLAMGFIVSLLKEYKVKERIFDWIKKKYGKKD